jgi:hypothetical protein
MAKHSSADRHAGDSLVANAVVRFEAAQETKAIADDLRGFRAEQVATGCGRLPR